MSVRARSISLLASAALIPGVLATASGCGSSSDASTGAPEAGPDGARGSGDAGPGGGMPGDGGTMHEAGGGTDGGVMQSDTGVGSDSGGGGVDAGGGDGASSGEAGAEAGGRDGGGGGGDAGAGGSCEGGAGLSYDAFILCDGPVAYWGITGAKATEPDMTGNGNTGTYKGGTPKTASLPNGDTAADFNGSSQYLTIPSNASLSIPTTGNMTWEGWIEPDVLQFPHDDGSSGYVDWMGKCDEYSPTCEWEARMYDTTTMETPNRPNRLSAYVFNSTAGLGSAADWQPVAGLVKAGSWYHVVGEYTTLSQPSDCANAAQYPGSIRVWVNGVPWNQASHDPTGCMSQYDVVPTAGPSALNIGTMAADTWFQGAIGKVAVYDYLMTQSQITRHYTAMTGQAPTGSCAATCNF